MTVGCVKSSEAKADTLDSTDENYLFGSLAHLDTRYSMLDAGIEYFNINPKKVFVQGKSLNADNSQID